MKKKIIGVGIVIIVVILLLFLTGCGSTNETSTNQDNLYQNTIKSVSNGEETQNKKVSVEYYGKFVNYPIDLNNDKDNTNDWKIFYSDENNIFLISADYVLSGSEYLTLEKAGMNRVDLSSYPPFNSYIYNVKWEDIDKLYNNGLKEIDSSIINKYMLDEYHNKYPNSTNTNVKATSSLLDTNNWSRLVDDTYGESAIGSPTLEMWVSSWNEKGYTTLYCNNCTELGYFIDVTNIPQKPTVELFEQENNGCNDTLYFPHHNETFEGCAGYYLASPSASADYLLNGIGAAGTIGMLNYESGYYGIRPVVALNSNVTIQYVNDNGVIELICN